MFFFLAYYFNLNSWTYDILGPSLVTQLGKNLPSMQETPVQFLVRKIPWRRDKLPTSIFLGFPWASDSKWSACNEGDLGLSPGLRRSPGGGHGNPLQYSCLGNPKDREAWWATVHGVTKIRTWLRTAHIIRIQNEETHFFSYRIVQLSSICKCNYTYDKGLVKKLA